MDDEFLPLPVMNFGDGLTALNQQPSHARRVEPMDVNGNWDGVRQVSDERDQMHQLSKQIGDYAAALIEQGMTDEGERLRKHAHYLEGVAVLLNDAMHRGNGPVANMPVTINQPAGNDDFLPLPVMDFGPTHTAATQRGDGGHTQYGQNNDWTTHNASVDPTDDDSPLPLPSLFG